MKRKITVFFAMAVLLLLLFGTVGSFAVSYTYSIEGLAQQSPDAYKFENAYDSAKMKLSTNLNNPTDIEVDDEGNVYIADPNNDRIVVLNEYYQYRFEISTFKNNLGGGSDSLDNCQGVFVWEGLEADENGDLHAAKYIYVADTDNDRIVVFDEAGGFIRIIGAPSSDIFDEGQAYRPKALAVDSTGHIYVVSSEATQGIIALSSEGEFQQFLGAQKASVSAWTLFWRRFQSAETIAQQDQIVPMPYGNIAIDANDFLWVTNSDTDEADRAGAIRDKASAFAPVKRLNTAGTDIMKRNGFFSPAGEVDYRERSFDGSTKVGVSKIVDVALGPQGIFSIIDQKRSKIYTYDDNGELLFVFGDDGNIAGNIQTAAGIVYQGEKMLVLDSSAASFTVYSLTDYGRLLLTAIEHNNERQYSLAESDWKEILKSNNNFDAAYVGLGKAYYRQGRWEEAMDYFQVAYNTSDYSTAFVQWRKDWLSDFIWLVPIIVVAVCVLVWLFFRYAGKVNKRAAVSGKKKTLWEELLYAFHVIFHPFDGYWDLKHEKRGSVRAALIILAATVLVMAYNSVGVSYLYSPRPSYTSVIIQLSSLIVPLLLFVTANWCLTTLFEGEGSFKDVFIASCYSLTPIVLLMPLATIMTHFVSESETGFVTLVMSICFVWLGLLLFFGTMVTHDYSLGKNIGTILGTILGMVVIMFVVALFSNLLIKMVSFVSNIISEIQFRM